jgi:hypothetical protein
MLVGGRNEMSVGGGSRKGGKRGGFWRERTLNGEAWINCGVVVRQRRLPRSTRESNCRKDLCSRPSFSMSA